MPNALPPEILKLTPEERIELADLIYESVDDELFSDENIERRGGRDSAPLSPALQAELDRRFAEYDANPKIATPVEELLTQMKSEL